LEKKNNSAPTDSLRVSPAVLPTATSTPVLSPTPQDEFINSSENTSSSDEISDMEKDLNTTDTSPVREDLENLDESVNP
jgi:hypothetical protein